VISANGQTNDKGRRQRIKMKQRREGGAERKGKKGKS
jgi:hypothetical protein